MRDNAKLEIESLQTDSYCSIPDMGYQVWPEPYIEKRNFNVLRKPAKYPRVISQ
jgi:hypothetical protein